MGFNLAAGLVFFNIPEGPAAAYQRGCVMFFTMLLFELLPFCYVSFYSWDRKFFLADRESGIYATSAYYVAHMCASKSFLIPLFAFSAMRSIGLYDTILFALKSLSQLGP